MTKEEIATVERVTGWRYHSKKSGAGGKFVVASVGKRRKGGEWSAKYFELVLWCQRRLKLTLWVDADRYDLFKRLELGFAGWSFDKVTVAWPKAPGIMDRGNAIAIVLDVPTEELYANLGRVIQTVTTVQAQLRACCVPI